MVAYSFMSRVFWTTGVDSEHAFRTAKHVMLDTRTDALYIMIKRVHDAPADLRVPISLYMHTYISTFSGYHIVALIHHAAGIVFCA